MGRPALQPEQISEFRERLCDAALELFAERGYDGFTLRALGRAVGCSPTTPYRYFENKEAIFDAVCGRAFEDLCANQEAAHASARSAWEAIRGQGRAYLQFARRHPHTYRAMFDLRGTSARKTQARNAPEPVTRSWKLLVAAFERARDAGELDGDPARLAHSFWASMHGAVSLELAGRIFLPMSADELASDAFAHFERAYGRPRPNEENRREAR